MPSRCANTGTRASASTRATRLLPPRGTMTSTLPFNPVSSRPTAARARVGTSVMVASGKPASRKPCTRQSWIARQERKLSEPPRRITALPDFRHSTPASAATLGRLSKITATTPSGTRTRSITMPFGRCQLSVTTPTGSAISPTVAMPPALPPTPPARRARTANVGDILGVGREDGRRVGADGALHGLERAIFLLGRGERQHPRRGAGAGSELVHQGRQIAIAVDGLQGRSHIVSSL